MDTKRRAFVLVAIGLLLAAGWAAAHRSCGGCQRRWKAWRAQFGL